MQRNTNIKAKKLKSFLLHTAQHFMEPVTWDFFSARLRREGSLYDDYLIINDNDLPIIRDLKALVNIQTALERLTEDYTFWTLTLIYKAPYYLNDLLQLNRNYAIYESTESELSHYLQYAKEQVFYNFIPKFIAKKNELWQLCTNENLEKAAYFSMEQLITLEGYQQNHIYNKNPQKRDRRLEEKTEQTGSIIDKSDFLLKWIYKDKFEDYFRPQIASPKPPYDYYPENEKDNNTVKNIKKLANGLTAINEFLDEYAKYKQSKAWVPVFFLKLKRVYDDLGGFDYQAIIAEQSTPIAGDIKQKLKDFNVQLQKLACLVDQFEGDRCLKEGCLLHYVDLLIQFYDQIIVELKIPIQYELQRRIYFDARLKARETHLAEIDTQLILLSTFLRYKNNAMERLPKHIIDALKNYINDYQDEICMDRDNLKKYKFYLANAINERGGIIEFIETQLEYMANKLGKTIHSELMKALQNRFLYLQKQKIILTNRLVKFKTNQREKPYDYFNLTELNKGGHQKFIFDALQKRSNELDTENQTLVLIASEVKPAPAEEKNMTTQKKIGLDAIDKRLQKKIILKATEFSIFSAEKEKIKESFDFSSFLTSIRKETCLSVPTIFLLNEIEEILKTPEQKQEVCQLASKP